MTNSHQKESLYDRDFYLWLESTANLLETNKLDELDIDNLLEEIRSMGVARQMVWLVNDRWFD